MRKTPHLPELLDVLESRRVEYVVSGSVAAMIYGVELTPGDLDVVPAADRANLERLAEVLREVEARPHGPFGEWTTEADGERRWVARPTTDAELDAWVPEPNNPSSFDQLLETRFGDLDIVPELTGTYDQLMVRADRHQAFGHNPLVAHIDDVLARLTVPRREKDIYRVSRLRQIQRERG